MNDSGKTPMERFEDLARKMFRKSKDDPRRAHESEEDAEEIMEGGIPPNEGEEPE
jgi:hypothetical protein